MKPVVIVIGGMDSSGGAGLSRDIATLTELGCEARPVVTAVTAQTDNAVRAVTAISPDQVAEQLSAALSTGQVSAIKTGMLHSAETVTSVATVLREFTSIPVVIDPVLMSSSGTTLLNTQGIAAIKQLLLPLCTLITPNLPEATILANGTSIECQARDLLGLGAQAVLIKGGHGTGDKSIDRLFQKDQITKEFAAPRLDATLRGTGCMLASAIAAHLGAGGETVSACMKAKKFADQKLQESSTAIRHQQNS